MDSTASLMTKFVQTIDSTSTKQKIINSYQIEIGQELRYVIEVLIVFWIIKMIIRFFCNLKNHNTSGKGQNSETDQSEKRRCQNELDEARRDHEIKLKLLEKLNANDFDKMQKILQADKSKLKDIENRLEKLENPQK